MHQIIEQAQKLFPLEGCILTPVSGHEGGRNRIFIVSRNGIKQYVLRISDIGDRSEADYLAETEFVHFLADNGYRYREGAPLSGYFYNTGKTLGAIHRLSRLYTPLHPRTDYFNKYNMTCLNRLIPDEYGELKKAITKRLDAFHALPKDSNCYGLVHFDFSDGNYHIDMDTGRITVFDFDNCMNCWYMFDLANLWIHNEGWTRQENVLNIILQPAGVMRKQGEWAYEQ